jgi:hypothetical protein
MSFAKQVQKFDRKGSREFKERFQGRMNIMTKQGITQLIREDVSSPIDKEASPTLSQKRKRPKRKEFMSGRNQHKRTKSTKNQLDHLIREQQRDSNTEFNYRQLRQRKSERQRPNRYKQRPPRQQRQQRAP